MKKFLSRIIAIALVAVLFTAPTTAQAATWLSITDNSVGDYTDKDFVFDPSDPLIVGPGQTGGLPNNATNGGFYARAGQLFTCSVMFTDLAESNVRLYNQSTGQFVALQENVLSNFGYISFTVTQSGYYIPVLQSINGYTIVVDRYSVYVV